MWAFYFFSCHMKAPTTTFKAQNLIFFFWSLYKTFGDGVNRYVNSVPKIKTLIKLVGLKSY